MNIKNTIYLFPFDGNFQLLSPSASENEYIDRNRGTMGVSILLESNSSDTEGITTFLGSTMSIIVKTSPDNSMPVFSANLNLAGITELIEALERVKDEMNDNIIRE